MTSPDQEVVERDLYIAARPEIMRSSLDKPVGRIHKGKYEA
jgi:hypothetical protein